VDSGGGLPSAFSILHCGSKETSSSLRSLTLSAAAGTAVAFSISIGEAELGSTIVVRIGEGDTCQELRVENNLHFALDYLIRWDYISIRTGASGPIGERRIQS